MKKFVTDFYKGITAYPAAWRFASANGLWKMYAVPAVFSLLLYLVAAGFAWHYTGLGAEKLLEMSGLSARETWWSVLLSGALEWLAKFLILILYLKMYRWLILLMLSPVLSWFSEKYQCISRNVQEPPFRLDYVLKDTLRGLQLSLSNMLREMLLTIPLALFGLFVPVIAPFAALLILLIESYYTGFGMLDLRNEFLRIPGKESRLLIETHRGLTLSNGLIFNILLWIPPVGVLVGPLLAVLAAGISFNQAEEGEKLEK